MHHHLQEFIQCGPNAPTYWSTMVTGCQMIFTQPACQFLFISMTFLCCLGCYENYKHFWYWMRVWDNRILTLGNSAKWNLEDCRNLSGMFVNHTSLSPLALEGLVDVAAFLTSFVLESWEAKLVKLPHSPCVCPNFNFWSSRKIFTEHGMSIMSIKDTPVLYFFISCGL